MTRWYLGGNFHDAIHRVALGDSPQIDFNSCFVKPDGPLRGVQFQMLIADPLEGLTDFGPRWQL
jgi:hypothetical protein